MRVYATMSSAVDTADQAGAAMISRAMSALAQVGAASSFVDPELLAVGETKLREWINEDTRLKLYEHYFNDLFRKQTHVRNAEVEELLGMLRDPFSSTSVTTTLLTNADFKFKPARDRKNKKVELTQSTFDAILNGSDRKARKTAWENYNDLYLKHKNTLANNLATSIKQNVFNMRARSSIQRWKPRSSMGCSCGNVPQPCSISSKRICRCGIAIGRSAARHWAVKTLHPYDVWAPLTTKKHKVPIREGCGLDLRRTRADGRTNM
jgi:oligoendopeptidase F